MTNKIKIPLPIKILFIILRIILIPIWLCLFLYSFIAFILCGQTGSFEFIAKYKEE